MFDITLSRDYLVDLDGTSEGTQDKFYKDGFWYKQNRMGEEAAAEVLSSVILKHSSLSSEEYVVYEAGMINGTRGCRSRDFLSPGENLITLYRFYEQLTGQKLNEIIYQMDSPQKRADFTLQFFQDTVSLDLTDYFRKIFTMDLLNLNEDRHFNNLALIRRPDGSYRPAPIFDNGKSLFIGNDSVNRHLSFEENRKRIFARPFSADCETQYRLFPQGFTVDFNSCRRELQELEKTIRDTEEYEILQKNLDYVQSLLPELFHLRYNSVESFPGYT